MCKNSYDAAKQRSFSCWVRLRQRPLKNWVCFLNGPAGDAPNQYTEASPGWQAGNCRGHCWGISRPVYSPRGLFLSESSQSYPFLRFRQVVARTHEKAKHHRNWKVLTCPFGIIWDVCQLTLSLIVLIMAGLKELAQRCQWSLVRALSPSCHVRMNAL